MTGPATDPTAPTDRTTRTRQADPTDPTDRTDRTDRTTPTEPADPTDRTDRSAPTEPADPTDPTDRTTPTEPADPTDRTATADPSDPATGTFLAHRNLLFTVAYEMLGSAADAEDVLQETWLRWVKVDLAGVEDRRAYLVRITTRQALNRLRTLRRRKEAYVGQWLPEPLLTAPDVAEDVELADSLSMAMMLVLERLSPTERAVFVLREVFDVGYDEIAAAVDRTPAAVHQIAHRARRHVEAGRPRGAASPRAARAAVESFRQALETGDPQVLLDVLAPQVVLVSDGGGVKRAALRPIVGAQNLARFYLGGRTGAFGTTVTSEPTVVNGQPALVMHRDGELDGVMAFRVEDGLITGLYYVRNPQKLTRVTSETPLTLR